MATFRVPIIKIRAIEPIPDSDFIELAVVGDYRSVIKKGQFVAGDLTAYIPEAALVPQELLKEIGLEGKLAGAQKNRVKAVVLRGCLSQGICIPIREGWVEDQDVAGILGITKYLPPIPSSMSGQVYALGREYTFHYDIDNVKSFEPGTVIKDGEIVVFSEKVHGTFSVVGCLPVDRDMASLTEIMAGHVLVVSSKGMFDQGLAFKQFPVEANEHNLYCRVARSLGIEERILKSSLWHMDLPEPVYVLGESFGQGVQSGFGYGASTARNETLGFRVFDIFVGYPMIGHFLDDAELDAACADLGLSRVPILYRGPYSREVMLRYTEGQETVSGVVGGLHVREGIVMKPVLERKITTPHLPMSRVQLKSVSTEYLKSRSKQGDEITDFE